VTAARLYQSQATVQHGVVAPGLVESLK
jgi:hypothetical protein